MIRLFTALPIPDDIAERLIACQAGIPGARWRPREALHITLRFFGEVTPSLAADLDEALSETGADALELSLAGAGAFGDREHMRAVWAGVTASEPLQRLAGRCDRAARRCGLKAEGRAFRPHITLAYLRRTSEPRVAQWVQEHNLLSSQAWLASAFHLYSSWLSQDGSRYELERVYPLS